MLSIHLIIRHFDVDATLEIGAHQENIAQKRFSLTFTRMKNFYTCVSNKDLSRIKSPSDNKYEVYLMTRESGFRQKEVYTNRVRI